TVNGQKAVGVPDKAKGGTLYVASTGAAYPLEIAKSGPSGGSIVFDRWNKPGTLIAPAAAMTSNQRRARPCAKPAARPFIQARGDRVKPAPASVEPHVESRREPGTG